MSQLARWPEGKTVNIYGTTKLWILLDGKIEHVDVDSWEECHEEYWGQEVWDIDDRGYVIADQDVVTCHNHEGVSAELERKLAKAFKDVCYLKESRG